jgi:hypothetical protein
VRQGQQNRRGRGRNNGRKGGGHHNPLSRSFESNGPDVKIRGTPAHIAEKYIALARDAQSSGDPVLAENYLQHAEHYSRIIMAYREQLNQPGEGMNGNSPRMRGPGDMSEASDEFGEEEGEAGMAEDGFPQPPMPPQHGHQQSRHQGGDNRQDRPFRRDQGRHRERYNDRGGERYGDRERQGFDRDRDRQPEAARPQPQDRPQEQVAEAAGGGGEPREREPRRRDRFQQPHEQPDFLRRPVRRARSTENGESSKDEPRD